MGSIISVHSYRGGTGKSNVAANLAWLMAREDKRVAVLDTDLQSPGVHMVLGVDQQRLTYTLSDFLFGKCDIIEAAYDLTSQLGVGGEGRLYLLPSSMSVEAISRIIGEGYDVGTLHDHFRTLIEELNLDYLVLDTHPGLNRETLLTTSVSDLLLILLRPDTQDFHGTAVLLEVARALKVPRTFMVANKVAQSLRPSGFRTEVEKAFGCEVLGLLPLSEDMAVLGSRGLIALEDPGHPIATDLSEVAHRLVTALES